MFYYSISSNAPFSSVLQFSSSSLQRFPQSRPLVEFPLKRPTWVINRRWRFQFKASYDKLKRNSTWFFQLKSSLLFLFLFFFGYSSTSWMETMRWTDTQTWSSFCTVIHKASACSDWKRRKAKAKVCTHTIGLSHKHMVKRTVNGIGRKLLIRNLRSFYFLVADTR